MTGPRGGVIALVLVAAAVGAAAVRALVAVAQGPADDVDPIDIARQRQATEQLQHR